MNKKEVSMFMMGIIGRLLCGKRSDFIMWIEERLDSHVRVYTSDTILDKPTSREIRDSITDEEWQEIADFFESGEDNKVSEDKC